VLLASAEYETQKQRYAQGMTQFITESRTLLAQTIQQEKARAMLASGLSFALVTFGLLVALVLLRRRLVQPLRQLAHATAAITAGALEYEVSITSQDAIGTLQHGFNHMVRTIQQQTRGLHQQVAAAETARSEAEQAQAQMAAQLDTIEQQQGVIRDMSVPILPLTQSAIVMPLVGALDTVRLRLVQEQALRRLDCAAIDHLILDITGVPVVDTQVAQGLVQVTYAAGLLGTKVILVGIRPEVAQTLVSLGIDLSAIIARSSLQSGIAYVLGNRTIN
jgi:rsbT co-antagonist protein RsbR